MNIRSATRQYESWLAKHLQLIPADLRAKHKAMAEGVFPFLRATFYRWAQIWRQECPDLAAAPEVLGIGDLHVENFGTWRDKEGRLIWGVNDFDEAAPMPYTNDLARLAASARLAIRANHLSCDPDAACDAMLEGYTEAMKGGGSPFVLAERHHWLMGLAQGKLRDPVRFWERLNRLPTKQAPLQVKRFLTKELPEPGLPFRVVHRRAGLGSLGRPRFTLLAEWRGGMIVREAKALAVSAWHGLEDGKSDGKIWYQTIIRGAVRVQDPFLAQRGNWIMRRLAPDCCRIELSDLPAERDELKLLWAMGWETANLHMGSRQAVGQVKRDLAQRPSKWLRKAAARLAKATSDEWEEWRQAAD